MHGVLVGKPEGRRPLGRPRRRWVDNKLYNVMNGLGMWRIWVRRGDAWGVNRQPLPPGSIPRTHFFKGLSQPAAFTPRKYSWYSFL